MSQSGISFYDEKGINRSQEKWILVQVLFLLHRENIAKSNLSFYWLASLLRHFIGISLDTVPANILYGSGTVRSKYETKKLCYKIIKIFTVRWIREFLACGTRWKILLNTAWSNLAPGCLLVFMTTRALLFKIGSAGPAV